MRGRDDENYITLYFLVAMIALLTEGRCKLVATFAGCFYDVLSGGVCGEREKREREREGAERKYIILCFFRFLRLPFGGS